MSRLRNETLNLAQQIPAADTYHQCFICKKVSAKALIRRPLQVALLIAPASTASDNTYTTTNRHTYTSVTIQTIPGSQSYKNGMPLLMYTELINNCCCVHL